MNENRVCLELCLHAKTELMGQKFVPVQLCPPQILHGPILESVRPWEGEWTLVMENKDFTQGSYGGGAYKLELKQISTVLTIHLHFYEL